MKLKKITSKTKRKIILSALALCILGTGWFFSSSGQQWRLHRIETPDLVTYTVQHPEDAKAFFELAQRLESQGFKGEAVNSYLAAARLAPEHTEAWLGACRVAMSADDGEVALDAAQKAVQFAAGKSSSLVALGSVYARGGLWEKALDAYLQATKSDPQNAEAWDGVGEASLQRKKGEEAIASALKATQLDEKQGRFWLHLAQAYRAGGDLPHAKEAILRTVQLDRRSGAALTEMGIIAVQSAKSSGDFLGAEPLLRTAVSLLTGTPRVYEPCYQLGQLFLIEKKYAQAEAMFRQALEANPKDERSQFALVRSLMLQGRSSETFVLLERFENERNYRQGLAQLKMRIGREPNRLELLEQLAQLYEAQGEWHNAVEVWKMCVKKSPDRSDWRKKLEAAQSQELKSPQKTPAL